MFRKIEELRKKSDIEKKSFAVLFASILTAIVVFIWVVTVVPNILSGEKETANTSSPIKNISTQFKNIFDF